MNDPVAIVVLGIAEAFSGENMGVRDPVASSTTRAPLPGKNSVAALVKADAQNPNILGRCLTPTGPTVTNQIVEVLVDIAE